VFAIVCVAKILDSPPTGLHQPLLGAEHSPGKEEACKLVWRGIQYIFILQEVIKTGNIKIIPIVLGEEYKS
jgi:hypothetical protein